MPNPNCKENDPNINNSELLLRRIPPQWLEGGRISYEAFNEIYCSVEVESKSSAEECLAHLFPEGIKPENIKKHKKLLKKGWGIGGIFTSLPRENDQTVYFDPIEIPQNEKIYINEAHALICGEKDRGLLLKMAESSKILLGGRQGSE